MRCLNLWSREFDGDVMELEDDVRCVYPAFFQDGGMRSRMKDAMVTLQRALTGDHRSLELELMLMLG